MIKKLSSRLARLQPYPFARQAVKINELRAKGVDVIRMDIGSPDLPPDDFILEAAKNAMMDPDIHGYPPMSGSPSFLKAISQYYQNRFCVELDPENEVSALIGSKEGIFHITQTFIDDGDVVLVPDPGYPAYQVAAEWAGGEAYPMPLREANSYLPDLQAIPASILQRAKMIWINYPNNPTSAVADLDFYREVYRFAVANQLLICHDAAYCDVAFDGYAPHSFLEVDGAIDHTVEFGSLSKTYNMAGWRIGTVAGNPKVIRELRKVKSNIDSGIFNVLLAAGERALTGSQKWIAQRNKVYATRRNALLEGIQAIGLDARTPKASLYIWAKIPEGDRSESYADMIMERTGVCFAPGTFFGKEGEGYVRISIATKEERFQEALTRISAV